MIRDTRSMVQWLDTIHTHATQEEQTGLDRDLEAAARDVASRGDQRRRSITSHTAESSRSQGARPRGNVSGRSGGGRLRGARVAAADRPRGAAATALACMHACMHALRTSQRARACGPRRGFGEALRGPRSCRGTRRLSWARPRAARPAATAGAPTADSRRKVDAPTRARGAVPPPPPSPRPRPPPPASSAARTAPRRSSRTRAA